MMNEEAEEEDVHGNKEETKKRVWVMKIYKNYRGWGYNQKLN